MSHQQSEITVGPEKFWLSANSIPIVIPLTRSSTLQSAADPLALRSVKIPAPLAGEGEGGGDFDPGQTQVKRALVLNTGTTEGGSRPLAAERSLSPAYNHGTMAIKVIIAPQEFKGALSALAAAEASERGGKAGMPEAATVVVPVADGGDGTLDALVEGSGGRVFRSVVTGPLGQPLEARWGVMGDGQTAVIEMALASGLALVPPQRRDPYITTTRGTGEIIAEALDRGFSRIVVGLGGSATNDGGAGMASALGARSSSTGCSVP